ncbi:MAG TPA: hypothetical protein VFD36_29310 [Kofleriaceae bacterium]|nr:hypothetical protein [Kofleriaceae bacterium]
MGYVGLGASDPIVNFGTTAARGMIARIKRLPAGQRTAALQAAMDQVDPTLRSRTEKYARSAQQAGVPVAKALEVGLSRALSEGVVTEFAAIGRGQKKLGRINRRKKVVGLGDYVGLGENNPFQVVNAAIQSEKDQYAAAKGKKVQIGPFTFPADQQEKYAVPYSLEGLKAMPAAQRNFIRDMLIKGAGDDGPWHPFVPKMKWIDGHMTYPSLWKWIEALGLRVDQKLAREMIIANDPLAWNESQGVTYDRIADKDISPILTFQHPISGHDWGIFLVSPAMKQFTDSHPPPPAANDKFYLYYRYIPTANWWHKLGRFVKHLPATIVAGEFAVGGAVKDAAEWVGDQACKLACQPNAVQAAAAAGAANPAVGLGAGTGVVIANAACKCGPAVAPPIQTGSGNLLLYVLLGGGALLGAIALTQRGD